MSVPPPLTEEQERQLRSDAHWQKMTPLGAHAVRVIRARLAYLEARVVELEREREMANGCLDVVRDRLASFGIEVQDTAPMFYDNAIETIVARLANHIGLTARGDVVNIVRGEPR